MKPSIEKLRIEYGNHSLLDEDLDENPYRLFEKWLIQAIRAQVFEPNGMVLSTLGLCTGPSARTVLLKQFDERGFIFYTNRYSRKGEQLAEDPRAALTFWWREIYRQVTVEGTVSFLSKKETESYFAKRPRGSQLAAHASLQSQPLTSRTELEERFRALKKQYQGKKIPCPENWSGYCLIPHRFEFWQGRKDRLHDRVLFVYAGEEWLMSRLFP